MRSTILSLTLLPVLLFGQEILTAEQAIKTGLQNNFAIRVALNNQEISDNNTGRGTAEFLPRLDASAGYQLSKSEQETNSPFSFGTSDTRNTTAQLALNWTLFDGMKMFITNARYRELARLGEAQARNTVESTSVAILRAFFNVVQQKDLLAVAGNTMEISRLRLDKERVRQDLGSASSTDFLDAQVSFNNDTAVVINRELDLLIAKQELNILLGRDPATPFEVEARINVRPLALTVEELLELALERNSILQVAIRNKAVADADLGISRSAFYPILSAGASYGYSKNLTETSRFDYQIESESREGRLGLTLSYNLFNGMRDDIGVQNARLQARNRELEYLNARNEISGLVRDRYTTWQKRMELMALQEENVLAARQNMELQQDRYQIGAASSLEFRDAQNKLALAEATLIVATYQARISRLEIEQLTGSLDLR
jgi:outer membrane protein TolC